MLPLSTALVPKSVSSRWSVSLSLSAGGLHQKIIRPTSHLDQTVTVRTCMTMLTRRPLLRSSCPSSLQKPYEWQAKRCRFENFRVPARTKIEVGWQRTWGRRERRGHVRTKAHAEAASSASQHTLFGMPKETSAALRHARIGQLVIDRMAMILEGSLPPRPPASKIRPCNRA